MADWGAIVGPALSAVTQPLRLAQGTLTIACAGPVAMELQHLAPELLRRINGALGKAAVERLRFVQQAPAGSRPHFPPARPEAPLPSPVRDRLGTVPEGELREALENLARAVYRNR